MIVHVSVVCFVIVLLVCLTKVTILPKSSKKKKRLCPLCCFLRTLKIGKHCVLFTVRYRVASQPLMRTSLSCQQTVPLPAEVMRVEAHHHDLLPSPSTSPISICNRALVKHRQSDSFWPAALLLCMWEVVARAAGHPCRNLLFLYFRSSCNVR